MAKAAPEEQFKLLDLQAVDSRLNSLDAQAKSIKADPRLAERKSALDAARAAESSAGETLHSAQQDVTALEDEVGSVEAKIKRDEERLAAGGLSKDLMALQADVAKLTERRSGLEDTELEAMEALENAQSAHDAAAAATASAKAAMDEVVGELQGKLGELSAQRKTAAADRGNVAGTIEPGLLALYEKTSAKHGVGAARMFHGTSEGSGMKLSPGDLAEVTSAAADDVVFCPDSGVILVRSEEWS